MGIVAEKWELCDRCKQLINPHEEAAHLGRVGFLHLTCLTERERAMLAPQRK